MRFKKITYRIADRIHGSIEVSGYAVEDKSVGVLYCVREIAPRFWKADHFESGFSIPAYAERRDECAQTASALLNEAVANGEYAAAIGRLNQKGGAA